MSIWPDVRGHNMHVSDELPVSQQCVLWDAPRVFVRADVRRHGNAVSTGSGLLRWDVLVQHVVSIGDFGAVRGSARVGLWHSVCRYRRDVSFGPGLFWRGLHVRHVVSCAERCALWVPARVGLRNGV